MFIKHKHEIRSLILKYLLIYKITARHKSHVHFLYVRRAVQTHKKPTNFSFYRIYILHGMYKCNINYLCKRETLHKFHLSFLIF